MSVVGAPQPWPPPPPPTPPSTATTTINCLPGICTVNCRQYCNYFYLQPPPLPQQQQFLPDNTSSDDNDSKSISPLMAALIALLTAAFLLLFYYTVISRLCRNRNNRRNNNNNRTTRRSSSQRVDPLVHDPVRPDTGLDQSFIRQITVFKYKRDDGLIEGTECAVCLGEFNEEESLRLMPNCEHAFHIPCIDTWLQNNSNCPLCRSGMNPIPAAPSAGGVSVAASRFERADDHVVVVREVERRGQVVVEVVADDDKDVT